MGLFKDVKKPVIRQSRATADISPLRPTFVVKQPPCSARCGAGADVRAFVTALAHADACGRSPEEAYEEAWRILADAHPFPATLGRICPHPCEHACHRRNKDGAVAVNALERWLGDVALARGFALPLRARTPRVGRVAIVGAGPAGLSCAYQLARRGHHVTVFEARDLPGGRLRDATRTGRLAAATVDAEIARLIAIGITLRRTAVMPEQLRELDANHDFVFVATGRVSPGQVEEGTRGGPDRLVVTDRVVVGGDAARPGLVSSALAGGRLAAEAIDGAINGSAPEVRTPKEAIAADRLTLAWYPDLPPHRWAIAPDATGVETPDVEITGEASRCMSCGLCMDCDRCWMYCTNNCFEKLPGGQHYRVNVEACNGCRKCADECPCGYIDMV